MGLFSKNAYNVEKEINGFKFSVPLLVTYSLSDLAAVSRQRINAEATIAKKLAEAKAVSERDYLQLLDAYYAEILQQATKAIQQNDLKKVEKIQKRLAEFPLKDVANYSLELIKEIEKRIQFFNQALENYKKLDFKPVSDGFTEIPLEPKKSNESKIFEQQPQSSFMALTEKTGFLRWFKSLRKQSKITMLNKQMTRLNQNEKMLEDPAYIRWTIDLAIEQINQKLTKAKTKKLSHREQDNLVISFGNLNILFNKNPSLIDEYRQFSQQLNNANIRYSDAHQLKKAVADFQDIFIDESEKDDFTNFMERIDSALKNYNSLEPFIKLLFEMRSHYVSDDPKISSDKKMEDFENLVEKKLKTLDSNTTLSVANSLSKSQIERLNDIATFYQQFAHFFDDQGKLCDSREENKIKLQVFIQEFLSVFNGFRNLIDQQTPIPKSEIFSVDSSEWCKINSMETASLEEKKLVLNDQQGKLIKKSLFNSSNLLIHMDSVTPQLKY